MADTPARLLRLLSLLQARPTWTAPELAERLEVTPRTVRRDVTRLRDLGYPVDAEAGPHGGYQLGRGGRLPPLLLDDDEAVAVALGLRAAADGSVSGLDDATVSGLAKLEQVLPAPLVERVRSIQAVTTELHGRPPDQVDAGLLVELARVCRQSERIRLGYVDREGRETERRVDPYRLVRMGPRWYLVARDVERDAWRTLRVDRIGEVRTTRQPVEIVDPPDPVELVQRGNAVAPYEIQATIRMPVTLAHAQSLITRTTGVHRPDGPDATIVELGGGTIAGMVRWLAGLGVPVEVLDPPELRTALRAHADVLLATNPEP
ncbi:MAG TPA: YafY family protein [Iamia sp.]|nr:YafY family protein [Iamia sp.]